MLKLTLKVNSTLEKERKVTFTLDVKLLLFFLPNLFLMITLKTHFAFINPFDYPLLTHMFFSLCLPEHHAEHSRTTS